MEQLDIEEGNKKTSSKSRQVDGKYWCSGVFNYTVEHLEQIFSDDKNVDLIIGNWEICPETNNKHLQCFFCFKKKCRPIEKYDLDIKWIKCKGNGQQNLDYIMKDKSKEKDDLFINNNSLLIANLKLESWRFRYWDLLPKQKVLKQILYWKIDDDFKKFSRSIFWIYDDESGWGKSTLGNYFIDNYNAIVVGGKESDMLCAMKLAEGFPDMVIVNQTFDKDRISYSGLESIKDGSLFSGKYESGNIRFPKPIVVVFSNKMPNIDKMGSDRFEHIYLSIMDKKAAMLRELRAFIISGAQIKPFHGFIHPNI